MGVGLLGVGLDLHGQDRLQVLKQWVNSKENAAHCESTLVLQRRSLQRADTNEELLTIQQMFEKRIPIEKIRAVVSRGGGIPDRDCPGVAKLTSYWVETSRTRLAREDFSQTAQTRVNAAHQGSLDVMGLAPSPTQATNAPTDLEALVNQAALDAGQSSGGGSGSEGLVGRWGGEIFGV